MQEDVDVDLRLPRLTRPPEHRISASLRTSTKPTHTHTGAPDIVTSRLTRGAHGSWELWFFQVSPPLAAVLSTLLHPH